MMLINLIKSRNYGLILRILTTFFENKGSIRISPVNQSSGPFIDARDPFFKISII